MSQSEGSQRSARSRGEAVRRFILENVGKHATQISGFTAAHFGITRQAVNKHLQKLVAEGALLSVGSTRDRRYTLASLFYWRNSYDISPALEEDQIWSRNVALVLGKLPQNVMDIWHFCFTEMFNNAIDHSGASKLDVQVTKTSADTQMVLTDNGVGIFKKIKEALHLLDERHAVLELAKGKLTTDPARHTGQGIFFASRLVDSFYVLSGDVFFSHEFGEKEDWIHEVSGILEGTTVFMKLNNHSSRIDRQIFEQYTSGDDFGFTKTVVPVRLAQYGEDKLISRSQAKRLLARVELFRSVWFDFSGVETIGQAFADEIFRVFARSHPQIEFVPVHATPQVQQMVNSARAQLAAEIGGI
jgi:anti-sigma regulatory factor (Ser/Thr protein kinase)/biotin operon repressor